MTYMNVGAYVNGERPKTKAALKRALAENPAGVTFDGTSPMGPQHDDLSGVNIPVDLILSVTGPDPYRARNWYANCKVNVRTGRVVLT